MNSKLIRIAIFCSGSGSNAEKIIEHFKNHPQIKVEVLLSNTSKAYALERAKNLKIPTKIFSREQFYNSDEIVTHLKSLDVSWIVLAGFLWLIPGNLIDSFPNRMINIHPALLPNYGGKGMYGMFVHQAIHQAKEKQTGISIHYVNHHYDEGKIIFQATCALEENDSPESIAKKVQVLEHEHFPKVIEKTINEISKNI